MGRKNRWKKALRTYGCLNRKTDLKGGQEKKKKKKRKKEEEEEEEEKKKKLI